MNISTETPKSTSKAQTILPPNRLLSLAGYGLFTYGLYNLVMLVAIGGAGPEATLGRIRQIVSLFPILYLGPIFIFTNTDSSMVRIPRNIWTDVVRWFTVIMAIAYLSFVPLSFFHQYLLISSDANVVTRLENTLKNRRQEIMTSIATLTNPQDIANILGRYPEISKININPDQTPAKIRGGIEYGINQGINAELTRLRNQQELRSKDLKLTVRTASIGSLVSGLSFLVLASRLMPWLQPAGQAVARTSRDIGTRIFKLTDVIRLDRKNPLHRTFKIFNYSIQRFSKKIASFKRHRRNHASSLAASRSKEQRISSRSRK